MSPTIGVNLRVTGHCSQGGRKYMEDMFSVAYQQTRDEKDLEYAYFGIFDGHGGQEAALFAKEHLMEAIVDQKNFWSEEDEDVVRAIREGFIQTHLAMWRQLEYWPKTASGLPSTSGTTASVVFIRHSKIYVGHVGDSSVVLGYQLPGENYWRAECLTKDHKPELEPETSRIESVGGKVVKKSGVARIVWNRPRIGHKGPVRRSTPIDEIPFLAVARSLGDLWSYNSELDRFIVSPEPDIRVIPCQPGVHRCLILATDGLWNVLEPDNVVNIVNKADASNDLRLHSTSCQSKVLSWLNPSKCLVDRALERWSCTRLRADNTTALTLLLDPPGPSKSKAIFKTKNLPETSEMVNDCNSVYSSSNSNANMNEYPPTSDESGIVIFARYRPEIKNSFHLGSLEDKVSTIPDSSNNEDSSTLNSSHSIVGLTDLTSPCSSRNVFNETPESIQSNEVTSSSPEDHEDNILVPQIYNHSINSNQPQLINHAYNKSETFLSEESNVSFQSKADNTLNIPSTSKCSSEVNLHRSRKSRTRGRRISLKSSSNSLNNNNNTDTPNSTPVTTSIHKKSFEKQYKRDVNLRFRHSTNNITMNMRRQRKMDSNKFLDIHYDPYSTENSNQASSFSLNSKEKIQHHSEPNCFRRKSYPPILITNSSTRMTRSITAASKRILRSGKNFNSIFK